VNLDILNNVPLAETAQSTFAVFNALQTDNHNTPEQRIAAMACAMFLAARHMGVSPVKLWEVANNLIHGADGKQVPEFRGAARYMKEEFTR
jgi:TRAP-type uncharacterized transport system substrate-binding protein